MLDFRTLGEAGPGAPAPSPPLVVRPDQYGACPTNYAFVSYTYPSDDGYLTVNECVYQAPPKTCPTCDTTMMCAAGANPIFLNGQWVCSPTDYICQAGSTAVKDPYTGTWTCQPATGSCPTCPICPACKKCSSGYALDTLTNTCVKLYPAPVPCPICPSCPSCPTCSTTCPSCPAPNVCPVPAPCPVGSECPAPTPCPQPGGFPWFWALASGLAVGLAAWGATNLAAAR